MKFEDLDANQLLYLYRAYYKNHMDGWDNDGTYIGHDVQQDRLRAIMSSEPEWVIATLAKLRMGVE